MRSPTSIPQTEFALTDPRGKRREHPAPCRYCRTPTYNGVPLLCDTCWRRHSPRFRAWEALTEIANDLTTIFTEGNDTAWDEHYTALSLRIARDQIGDVAHAVRTSIARRAATHLIQTGSGA